MSFHKSIVYSTIFFLLLNVELQAQLKLQGNVSDKIRGSGLPGVSVHIAGTQTGAVTDAKGNFLLNIPTISKTLDLIFSSVGFRTVQLSLNAETAGREVIVKMEEDLVKLDEVVITGQGLNVSKRRLSTTITTISANQLKDLPMNRLDQLIQSQVPNAQLKLTGGQAGAASIIQTRGFNSAFANSTPIIYVDGVRVDNLNTSPALGMNLSGGISQGVSTSALSDLPVDNIEKIEFINGGAATTLYGSDAGNGVLQIFTKKNGSGKANFNAGVDVGLETPTTDYLHFKRTKDLLYKNGYYNKYSMAADGGTGDFGFSSAASYSNSNGTLIHNQNRIQKLDFRTGFHARITNDISYDATFTYDNQLLKRVRNGNSGGYSGLWFAEDGASKIIGPTFNPVIDQLSEAEFARMKSFVDSAEMLQNNSSTVNRFQTSQSLRYQPLKNLLVKATFGIDYRAQTEQSVVSMAYNNHIRANAVGSLSKYDRNYLGLTLELTGQYDYKINNFSFLTTAGTQLFRNEDHQVSYIGTDIRDGALNIGQAATTASNEIYTEVANYGVFVQENIGYKNRYFFDLGLRGDANSAFGSSVGIQYYPKAGFSYIVSSEPFFENMKLNLFNTLKLRANYGLAGIFPPPFFNERTIDFTGFDGSQSASFGLPGNDDLRQETSYSKEVGVDLGILKNRVSLTINYFDNTTKNALFRVPVASSTGYPNQYRNIGKISNKGWEFSTVISVVENKTWDLRVRASANTVKNKVVSSAGAPPFLINGLSSRTVQIVVQEGYPIGYISGNYGVFNADGTLASYIPQTFLGSTIPTLTGSFGFNMRCKNISLFANADYQMGGYIDNWDKQFRINYGASTEGVPAAEINKNKATNWLNYSQLFVEKSDFIKVRTIGVVYSFDKDLLGKSFKNLTIGFTAVNPLNITASGNDPEAVMPGGSLGQGTATTGGLSYGSHSVPRQFIGSVKINF